MTESMRDRILAAAIQVIRGRGIVAATTKEIARTAGVSEGSLYNHFANKTALFAAALGEVTGTARAAMAEVLSATGRDTVEGNLTRLACAMVAFYGELLPMTGPVLADPELIAWLRADGPGASTGASAGPVHGHTALISYLEAERRLGRLAEKADPAYLAAALLGGCQQHAFLTRLAGAETVASGAGLPADLGDFAAGLVRTVLAGHLPQPRP
ncbi:TetR/AcrR family transcriptional regulator [Spirillospora sp. NPDC048911]|uniref:TetR/AcrR family transcriptional regulator n=1 Tax=Spirillospora sp. NPDC048911 TaxID=3364527 RepID=UPI0037202291